MCTQAGTVGGQQLAEELSAPEAPSPFYWIWGKWSLFSSKPDFCLCNPQCKARWSAMKGLKEQGRLCFVSVEKFHSGCKNNLVNSNTLPWRSVFKVRHLFSGYSLVLLHLQPKGTKVYVRGLFPQQDESISLTDSYKVVLIWHQSQTAQSSARSQSWHLWVCHTYLSQSPQKSLRCKGSINSVSRKACGHISHLLNYFYQ